MKITEKFNINEEVNFCDIELGFDNKFFVDPYLIYIAKGELAADCSNDIVHYFSQLLAYAKEKNFRDGYRLVDYLQENNEVRMGYSLGTPCGKGFGKNRGRKLFDEIANSSAAQKGLIEDIFDASVMLNGVGADRISDLTLNIILSNLIKYTQIQCNDHSIPTEAIKLKRPMWSSEKNDWVKLNNVLLPVDDNGKPIIFVPKDFARPYLVYTYKRFYNKEMITYYEDKVKKENLRGLMKLLKRGYVPSRKKIRRAYPCTRDSVVEYIESNINSYKYYKYKELNYISSDRIE